MPTCKFYDSWRQAEEHGTGIAFILLFAIGRLIVQTGMLHENLGAAHRKHAYQLMANELKIGVATLLGVATKRGRLHLLWQ